jgi:hypothetical protein
MWQMNLGVTLRFWYNLVFIKGSFILPFLLILENARFYSRAFVYRHKKW